MAQHGTEAHENKLVPLQTRSERPRSTSISDFAELSNRQEIWRYLPLDDLQGLDAEVIGEVTAGELSTELTGQVTASWIDSSESIVGSAGLPEDRISAIAWTNASKTMLVEVPADHEIAEPVFLTLKLEELAAKALHVLVKVGANDKGHNCS